MSTVDVLCEQMMTLPVRERAALATLLLASLESEPLDGDSQRAWRNEVEARSRAYSQGQLTAGDGRQLVDRVRRVLAQRRKPSSAGCWRPPPVPRTYSPGPTLGSN